MRRLQQLVLGFALRHLSPSSANPFGRGCTNMTGSPPDLPETLGDRYTLLRELGRGGMASVHLAEDRRYQRQVAVKILHGASDDDEERQRFLREIRVVAGLSHPRILPLLDSGEADGTLYFVMPFVDGESLRDRLLREKRLGIADAVRLARQVAEALHFAHERGVVHRDVKPENIMLLGNDALVADFGIALVRANSLDPRLTLEGLAMGTAHYMSPEQSTGSGTLDGRSDVYAVGCLLFEMLAGEPVFPGRRVVEVLTRHIGERPRAVRTLRPEVPPALEAVIERALAKEPADRFPDADAFARALLRFEQGGTDEGAVDTASPEAAPPAPGRRRLVLAGGALAAVLALGAAALVGRTPPAPPAVDGSIAVLPFRVQGADPALGYLREGMIDLLAVKLSGGGLPSAVDPRAVMGAVRARDGGESTELSTGDARALAQRLGAQRFLVGSIVGTPQRLVISASLESVSAEGAAPSLAEVEGPADSLPRLVDRLAAQLLALGAGESSQRLEAVTSTSLPALRDYLAGRALYRSGRYADAVTHFRDALATDTTFALAALGWRLAAGWTGSGEIATSVARAVALRDRLPARDRQLLAALTGPRYPDYSSEVEVLDAWRRATEAAPDLPETWYEYGDQFYHAGALMGIPEPLARAAEAFRRALAIDPDFAPALVHLAEIGADLGDAEAARRYGTRYTARDSISETADFIRWRMAHAVGDSASVRAIRARMTSLSPESLRRIVVSVQLDAVPGDDAERAAAAWLAAHRAPDLRWFALLRVHDLRLNRGDAAGALAITDSLRTERPGSRAWLRLRVEDALYGGGDRGAGRLAADDLARTADAPLARDAEERAEQFADLCTLWQWRLAEGPRDAAAARGAIARLRSASVGADGVETAMQNDWCAIALEALLAPQLVFRLDSLLLSGPRPMETSRSRLFRTFMMGNLLAARLHLQVADTPGALAAVRRRPRHGAGTVYLRTALTLERDLATRLRDDAGAREAARRLAALSPPRR